MLIYYLPRIKKLVTKIHIGNSNPFADKLIWLEIQEELILVLTQIESKIRKLKNVNKELKMKFSYSSFQLSKIDSLNNKEIISLNQNKIFNYQSLLTIFRNLGDSIAFTFINSYDIKPQSFKQSSGFISGKKGSRLERKCLRHTFNSGGIAILNDLTNCLRHFDLTIIIAKDVWIPVEIKSGRSPSKRDNRQKQKYTELMEFLIEDKPTDIFQKGYLSHRVSINKSPRNYVKVLNKCIEMSVQNGQIIKEVEDGLYFVINYNSEIAKDELFNNLNKLNLQQPYFFFLNNELINDSGFYPICLTLRKAEYFIDLLTSKLEIIVIFDSVYLKEKFEKRKLNFLQLDDDDDFVFQVEGIINNEPFEFKIGRYLINKMFFEFLSSSLLYNSIDHFAVLATTLVTDAQLHFQKHKNPNMVY